jgi:hypothetical protein
MHEFVKTEFNEMARRVATHQLKSLLLKSRLPKHGLSAVSSNAGKSRERFPANRR